MAELGLLVAGPMLAEGGAALASTIASGALTAGGAYLGKQAVKGISNLTLNDIDKGIRVAEKGFNLGSKVVNHAFGHKSKGSMHNASIMPPTQRPAMLPPNTAMLGDHPHRSLLNRQM